jgi:hypothetical protein
MAVFWVVAPCSLVEVYQVYQLHGATTQKTAIFLTGIFCSVFILQTNAWRVPSNKPSIIPPSQLNNYSLPSCNVSFCAVNCYNWHNVPFSGLCGERSLSGTNEAPCSKLFFTVSKSLVNSTVRRITLFRDIHTVSYTIPVTLGYFKAFQC